MSKNDLSGTWPLCLANLISIYTLDLSQIPISLLPFFNHSKLKYLNCRENEIHTDIDVPNLTPKFQLETLYLSGQREGGVFPKFLYYQRIIPQDLTVECISLSGLILSNNNLQGQIFPRQANCKELRLLRLDGNQFIGSVPYSILNCTGLQVLDVRDNHRTGSIPSWIRNVTFLQVFGLSKNNLFGKLPSSFGPLKIISIYLSKNRMEGSSMNAFYNCSESMTLDLSDNYFTRRIPKWTGKLPQLRFLLLGNNNLEGEMPIQQIESLDLSYNNLNGNIPQLTQLNFLTVFSVAHNNLSGNTPEIVAQFATFDKSSYEENPFLCGPPLSKSCFSSSIMPRVSKEDKKDHKRDGGFMDMDAFYMSFLISYAIELLTIAAVLYINPYW
ncbi:cuscuta receptor 1-like [Hevea brasiliensis]|uniref:cuscuta receptor 1-like n=1 Tax=Hevea brasiliensis TaxID=3981 RepID=UPI000B795C69|nr:cuscuta receptor 1-like [Hevea brasiliensis]